MAFQVLTMLVITSGTSFGSTELERTFRDALPRDMVDGSYSVVEPAISRQDEPHITHMEARFQPTLDTQPERTPIFQHRPEPLVDQPDNQPQPPVVARDNVVHRPADVGHKLLGDQQSLQELARIHDPKEKTIIAQQASNEQEDTVLKGAPLVSDSIPVKQNVKNKGTMLPIILKPFYTILQQQDATFGVPQVPISPNTRAEIIRLSQPLLQMDMMNPQTESIKPSHTNEHINCGEYPQQGRSLPPPRHQPGLGKSYEFAPSALPLVGGLPHDSARLQILSETPHHIYIHPPKVFPITPSPELSGPLLGGPPLTPRATTLAPPSRLSQIYSGHKRVTSGRTLFFDNSKPQQNLQTLQQQMYPIRSRPDMQYQSRPQTSQEQMLLMMQRRYVRNYNNQELLPYMQPVAVIVVPAETDFTNTKQN